MSKTYTVLFYVSGKFEGKISKVPWDSPNRAPITIFGNLPFNVATPFLFRLLKNISDQNDIFTYGRATCVLSFQHEVAIRMCAPPKASER